MANDLIRLEQSITGDRAGLALRATLSDGAGDICIAQCAADGDFTPAEAVDDVVEDVQEATGL